MERTYSTTDWESARQRAIERDCGRCTVARLLGGSCHGTLHVHHLVPIREGGDLYALDNLATVCAHHHPRWEALRRSINEERRPRRKRCPHRHVTRYGREQCEKRLNRENEWAYSST